MITLVIVAFVVIGILLALSYLGKPCPPSDSTTEKPSLLCSGANILDNVSNVLQYITAHMTTLIYVVVGVIIFNGIAKVVGAKTSPLPTPESKDGGSEDDGGGDNSGGDDDGGGGEGEGGAR
jgi:uncharacterized membrane protein YgcG